MRTDKMHHEPQSWRGAYCLCPSCRACRTIKHNNAVCYLWYGPSAVQLCLCISHTIQHPCMPVLSFFVSLAMWRQAQEWLICTPQALLPHEAASLSVMQSSCCCECIQTIHVCKSIHVCRWIALQSAADKHQVMGSSLGTSVVSVCAWLCTTTLSGSCFLSLCLSLCEARA